MRMVLSTIYLLLAVLAVTGCYPPPVQYATTALVIERRDVLRKNLLQLLPEHQRALPEARDEARWLADTAYKAAAGISRVNASHFPGWAGNVFVNTRMQDRGLCWHYQHDMFRELRRRPLRFFRLGCCVRDLGYRTEHNCLYIAASGGAWPDVWMLDAWMWNGRLKVDYGRELNLRRWVDKPDITRRLTYGYREGHNLPVEHWLFVRGISGDYAYYRSFVAEGSPQHRRMSENIRKGYREHPGSPTNY